MSGAPIFVETLLPSLRPMYQRAIDEIGEFDLHLEPSALSAEQVLRAHFCVADYFLREGEGDGLGGFGPKDSGLLMSALSRPFISFGGVSKWNSVHEKAATLLYGLVMNHPFHDANKRTAYLSAIYYLNSNGYTISVPQKNLEDLTVLIANRGLRKFSRYRDLRKTSSDPEVDFLAWYFRKNCRFIDRNQYLITYRELERILKNMTYSWKIHAITTLML